MRQPDTEGAFAGKPPQDFRRDLSELRKGIVRIEMESPLSALRRFHELKAEAAEAPMDPIVTFIPTAEGDNGLVSGGIDVWNPGLELQEKVRRGPGLKKTMVVFDGLINISLGEVRRHRLQTRQS